MRPDTRLDGTRKSGTAGLHGQFQLSVSTFLLFIICIPRLLPILLNRGLTLFPGEVPVEAIKKGCEAPRTGGQTSKPLFINILQSSCESLNFLHFLFIFEPQYVLLFPIISQEVRE